MIKLLSYPAMASPQSLAIISERITEYGGSMPTAVDPFCGTGRMLVPLRKAGYSAVGIDCSPIAILASRVYHQRNALKVLRADSRALEAEIAAGSGTVERAIDEGSFWFPPNAFAQLRAILGIADAVASTRNVRRVFWLALTDVVRGVSYVRAEEFKLHRMSANRRSVHRPNVAREFMVKLADLVDRISMIPRYSGGYRLIEGDLISTSLRGHRFGACVTSPPYGDSASTVGYGQFARVPLTLLCESAPFCEEYRNIEGNLDSRCLGGAACEEGGLKVDLPASIQWVEGTPMERFWHHYAVRLAHVTELLVGGGVCCLVLGNRTFQGRLFPLVELTVDHLSSLGLSLKHRNDRFMSWKRLPRTMRHRGGGREIAHAGMNYESVLTLVRS